MSDIDRRRRENKAIANARLIHRHVKRNPSTKDDICTALGIDESDFAAALRWSRRDTDPETGVANEIIGVTSSKPFLYYAAKTVEQADAYISQRARIADGHLTSIEFLLVKELDKFPAKSREISLNLTAIRRMREDIVYLLGDAPE